MFSFFSKQGYYVKEIEWLRRLMPAIDTQLFYLTNRDDSERITRSATRFIKGFPYDKTTEAGSVLPLESFLGPGPQLLRGTLTGPG